MEKYNQTNTQSYSPISIAGAAAKAFAETTDQLARCARMREGCLQSCNLHYDGHWLQRMTCVQNICNKYYPVGCMRTASVSLAPGSGGGAA